MKNGILYVVATPIGNLEDITFRAINTLKNVDIIAAEDTRHTLKLLNYYEISKHLISYHRHNEEIKSEELINELKNGKNIALVSDAGTPGICDPGEIVIKKCIQENIKVIPIPGACIFVNSLAKTISLLSTNSFKSFSVVCNLCGASYIITVCVLSFICSNFCFLFFLFKGKNPKNKNVSVFIPEPIKAFTKAHAPGIGMTFIFSCIHFYF